MDYKVLLVFAVLLSCSTFAFADLISDYSVPDSVPLNQKITATGLYDSNATKTGVLCSFYFLDETNKLVYRATDQYTVASGRFTMIGVKMSEPTFVRGSTYTLHSECGVVVADANFVVGQKQEVFSVGGFSFFPQGTIMDFMYFKDNGLMVFFLFIMIFVFVGLVVLGIKNLYG